MSQLSGLGFVGVALATAGMTQGQRLRYEERRRPRKGKEREWWPERSFSDLRLSEAVQVAEGGRNVRVIT